MARAGVSKIIPQVKKPTLLAFGVPAAATRELFQAPHPPRQPGTRRASITVRQNRLTSSPVRFHRCAVPTNRILVEVEQMFAIEKSTKVC